MKIFQVYYKHEQLDSLDPAFSPYDNTANPHPELREWYTIKEIYTWAKQLELSMWGTVSWKFRQKTGITGEDFVKFIENNPGHDVYFINPAVINEAVFANSWEQGDIHHAGISQLANKFLTQIGYVDVDVKAMVLDRTRTSFSNYFVGTAEFWNRYIAFIDKIFIEADKDPKFKQSVFGTGTSNYAADRSLPNFIFIVERLLSIFIELDLRTLSR